MRAAGRLNSGLPFHATLTAALGGLLFLALVLLTLTLAILGLPYGTGDGDRAEGSRSETAGGRWLTQDRSGSPAGGRWHLAGGRWS